ncbi:sugar nucleotide-binding protein [Lactiplantibacillus argentoratensis]|uniref:NAD-dependent epimerase/dehydratase family protein n=1 Tax=Lactiplantibacillus argentoratensis TaxID=271881 RepID=UPI001BDCDC73|nr:NAD-dependent epimerase/dehydratase family protein [Lactiplantibacillus argentoratensis]MBT1145135.1 sugar nucleotide-binding protein [Lactiplantibacillus argentoratensis]MBT1147980.1 sugar nucleotide-binding protein [Lactiplantibacillus argentoratensis]MBT1153826.1 sugar nucleotide-binding protein [Lactiplantibacillus argentoratensis]
MKKVLITGKTSYIGRSFKTYVEANYPSELQVDSISVRGNAWREYDFSGYDAVLHVAGKAHADVSNVSEAVKREYYAVNKDLAVAVAEKYKSERSGFSQFIYLSSIIVYGQKVKRITAETPTAPENFYGDSKVQAELALRPLSSQAFQVLLIRPPMIYGPDSKGNFPILVKLAKKSAVFPKVANQRSMLFVDNLNEFIKQLIIKQQTTNIYFPQNLEYVNTTELVREIRRFQNKNIILLPGFSGFIHLLMRKSNKLGVYASKAFGSLVYEKQLSTMDKIKINDYQVLDFERSIRGSI